MNKLSLDLNESLSTPRTRTVRWYYGLIFFVLLLTLIAQCILTYSEGRSLTNTFSFFTIQSNVLVLISSGLLAFYRPVLTGKWWRAFRLAALTGITVTGIIYIFFLAKYVHLEGLASLYNHVFHYVMPIAAVVGYIFIEPKEHFVWRDYLFLTWPILWLVYTMVRGAYFDPQFTGFTTIPSKYPYEFLDVTRTPMPEVIESIAFICFLIIIVGGLCIFTDKFKPFFTKRGNI